MSDLLLKVGDSSGYSDGDILCAFSTRRISHEHCHLQCWERKPNRQLVAQNSDGLVAVTDVLWDYQETLREYRFERLSRDEARITRLSDNESIEFKSNEVFTGFDGKDQAMDIDAFVSRRLIAVKKDGASGLLMFDGTNGEIWHGGKSHAAIQSKVDVVWTAVESKKQIGRTDAQFTHFPLGHADVRSHLPFSTDAFDDAAAATLVESEVDYTDPENPITLKKRKRYINWREQLADLDTDETKVLDRNRRVDKRPTSTKRPHGTIVKTKT